MAGNVQTISANGNGPWIKLGRGLNIVSFASAGWSTSSVGLQWSATTAGTNPEPVFVGDAAYAATSSTQRQISIYGDGEAAIRSVMSSYGGTAVTMKVTVATPFTHDGV